MNPLLTSGLATGADRRRSRTSLSVNLNKVALLRNTRTIGIPSVTAAAQIALEAGADGITVHPRPDARHIRRADVFELAELLRTRWPQAEYNIEGNPHHNLMALLQELAARGRAPQQCTFVPDSVEQATSDHGWRFPQDAPALAPLVAEAKSLGIRVSLFIDAELAADARSADPMATVRALGAERVELYTESYARAFGTPHQHAVLARFAAVADAALAAGLQVNAGHDLNRDNLTAFLAAVPGVQEVSIGHALVADALEFGLGETVRDYLRCISRAR